MEEIMQAKTANRTRFKSALYGMCFKNSKNQPFNNQRNFKLRSLVDRRHLWRSLNALIWVRHKQLLNLKGVVDPLPHSHDLSIMSARTWSPAGGKRRLLHHSLERSKLPTPGRPLELGY